MLLRKTWDDGKHVYFEWDAPAGAQWYTLYADGKRKSNHAPEDLADGDDGTYNSTRFRKGVSKVEIVATIRKPDGTFGVDVGSWLQAPDPTPDPDPVPGHVIQATAWKAILETSQTDPQSLARLGGSVDIDPDEREPEDVVNFGGTPDAWGLDEDGSPLPLGANRYTFAWVKTKRRSLTQPTRWANEGVVEFSDYPDEFVMVEAKRLERGYGGRITNFHLVGGDEAHNGVSPVSVDYRPGRSSDWPSDLQPGVVMTNQAELDDHRRGHWLLIPAADVEKLRGKVLTFVHRIKWSQGQSGYWSIAVFDDEGKKLYETKVTGIKTAYSNQQPRVYVWLGGYESAGLSSPAVIWQSFDYRGRTLEEALKDKPVLGSLIHSVSTSGGADSSITESGTMPITTP